MEDGVQRWVVDISKWDPSLSDFSSALSILPPSEHPSITRFVNVEDRKRALVSRLLQYSLVHQVLGIPDEQIVIKRTLEGKPYLECEKVCMKFPNFNFSVSHHGDYVAIASEPLCIVGLDIVYYSKPQKETTHKFVQSFSSFFSSMEWNNIMNAGSCEAILIEFYRYWSLKESYVKAIGSGLEYGLDKVEFHHTNWTNITVTIDGKIRKDWRFWGFDLGKGHWVSLARGHPRSATDTYGRTLNQIEFSDVEYTMGIDLPNISFIWKNSEHLISVLHKTTHFGE